MPDSLLLSFDRRDNHSSSPTKEWGRRVPRISLFPFTIQQKVKRKNAGDQGLPFPSLGLVQRGQRPSFPSPEENERKGPPLPALNLPQVR